MTRVMIDENAPEELSCYRFHQKKLNQSENLISCTSVLHAIQIGLLIVVKF